MHPHFYDDQKIRFYNRFKRLYGNRAEQCLRRLVYMLGRYGVGLQEDLQQSDNNDWSESDAVLITYGDMVQRSQKNKLADLCEFLNEYVEEAVSTLHILPFFPYSSDEGFAVIDYRRVRPDLGDWNSIDAITTDFNEQVQKATANSMDHVTRQTMRANYSVMADLVINHVSRESSWFEDYVNGILPAKDYFIEVNPDTDLSSVTRPRSTPLLTPVRTRDGKKHLWSTFSSDQIDLNFKNPDVLFEFLDILLYYISHGISVIRLDAIAYLWKKPGTSCIHLFETHEVVRLLRDFVEMVAPHVTLITETNVPHKKNISYFGEGDEAHMVYQFSLPPLLLHAILNEDASYLTRWAQELEEPPEGCLYFNFTASHDGIGVRPLEGLVPDKEFERLVESSRKRGGYVSYKTDEDGNESPYELNITYFDAFKDIENDDTELQRRRFMCSQILMLTLKGIPGIYFHSLMATPNYQEGVEERNEARAINRKRWKYEELSQLLDADNVHAQIFKRYIEILNIRRQHAAFNPYAGQQVFDWGDEFFVILRTSLNGEEQILSVTNLTSTNRELDMSSIDTPINADSNYPNLLEDGKLRLEGHDLALDAFETVWLKCR